MVSAGKVGPTDAFAKKYVAADKKSAIGVVESNASGGVARQKEYLEPVFVQPYRFTGNKKPERPLIVLKRHSPLAAHFGRYRKNLLFLFVEIKR